MKKQNHWIKLIYIIVLIMIMTILSWISTCGVIKLITMCFGLKFKWSIATGIWLIINILMLDIKIKD